MRSENNTESTAFKEEEAKILELSLFKTGSGRQTKVSYQDTLKAFVECQGLEGDTIDLYLCQGDKKTIICQDVLVDRYGIAETSIPLLSSDITTDLIINQEKESGEVYIAAVYNDQEVKSDTFKITSEVVTFERGNSPVKVGVVEVEEKEEILDPIDENISSNIIVKKIYEIDSFNDDTPLSIKEDRKMEEIKLHTLNAIYIDKTNISIILNIVNKENIQGCFIYPIITNIPDIEKDPEQYEESISDVDFSVSMIENKNWYKENTIGKNVTEIDLRLMFNKKTYESLYLDIFTFKETLTPQHQLKIKIEFKKIDTYRIYYDGNIEKYIFNNLPYDKEKKYQYVYHDEEGNEHEIGIFKFIETTEMKKGNIAGTKKVELIDIREFKGYDNNGVKLKFLTINTDSKRYYINPDCYAGLLGAMAKLNIDYLGFNGFSNNKAGSYPSTSHFNGEKGDLRYLSTNRKGESTHLEYSYFDVEQQNKFNDALYLFGWGRLEKMYSEYFTYNGNSKYLLNHTRHLRIDEKRDDKGKIIQKEVRHHHHLHLTGFDHSLIKIIEE
ncbi:Uncharacterised protein [Capnocytophaga granulosa]|nr:hypothetical protein [Capnocytophaga granulosa]SUX23849.1 Uncharacterised protein [Capnocytophaga granulosa]